MELNGTVKRENLVGATKLMASDLQTEQLGLLEGKQMQIVNPMTSDR